MKKSKEMFKKQLLCCAGCVGFGFLDIYLSKLLTQSGTDIGLTICTFLCIMATVLSIVGNMYFYCKAIKAMINGD